MENNSGYSPSDALADAVDAGNSARRRSASPRGFYLAHGVCTALLFLGISALPDSLRIVTILAAGAGLALLVKWYRDVTGVWVTPATAPARARTAWIAYAVGLVGLLLVTVLLRLAGYAWFGWPAAGVALLASPLVGHFLEPLLTEGEAA